MTLKKNHLHWPTLWHFCSQETWALPLAGSFFSALMFISATVNFVITRGFLTFSTIICLVLALIAIAAFCVTVYLLSKVYYVALLDSIGVTVDAHITDKLFNGKSMKGLSREEESRLLAQDVELRPDLYQIVYRYRFKQEEHIKTHSLEHDEVFGSLEVTQRIQIVVVPCRPDIARVDESYLLSQYREFMMSRWIEPDESPSLAQFRNGY